MIALGTIILCLPALNAGNKWVPCAWIYIYIYISIIAFNSRSSTLYV